MRVMVMISGKSLGGSKQAFVDHCSMLADEGFEIHPVIRHGSQLKGYCERLNPSWLPRLRQIRFYRSRFGFVRSHAISVVGRLIESVKPDVLVLHKQSDLPLLKEACPELPILVIGHWFNAKGLTRDDTVLPVSHAVKEFLNSRGITQPMDVLPNVIKVPSEKPQIGSHDVFTFGTLAVFRRKKNLELLIDACAELKRLGKPFRCVIGGAGHRRFLLRYAIWRKGLSKEVSLLPWVEDKADFYAKLDAYCLTSNSETFGIALLEAMSYGVPLVSTDCGGPGSIIRSSELGLLIPVGDVKALTEALLRLMDHPDKRQAMAKAAYDHVKTHYDYAAVAGRLAGIVREVA